MMLHKPISEPDLHNRLSRPWPRVANFEDEKVLRH